MADTYGPSFSVRLEVHEALVVRNWEVAKECFTKNDKAFSTQPRSLAVKLMGYDHAMIGMDPYGPHWRRVRKLAAVELLSSPPARLAEPRDGGGNQPVHWRVVCGVVGGLGERACWGDEETAKELDSVLRSIGGEELEEL
ncbi:Cytochrome P450 82A1 [Morus notabilis]|uniref:Cytochrome P450 82A1 n=1 Tax=Morus notabilis TaxID=981085 RepID=W9RBS3_9ROSA|nr:Cytochrome P450 82A1 [Morus notabilis]